MNLKELQKKVAEVLGVSNSQKELAFETFTEKISESLYEGITLKVPRIGFFQLKSRDNKTGPNRSIIFTPLSVDFTPDSQNLYLTFEVKPKSKNTNELDSDVFSIGVGKPLLPLTIDDLPLSETSFTVLKKSIEERAKELIAESDQIPNFNIFEDYYKISKPASGGHEIKSTLSKLTSDLNFPAQNEEPTSVINNEKYDILSSLMEEPPQTDEQLQDILESKKDLQNIPEDLEKVEGIVSLTEKEFVHEDMMDVGDKSSETVLAELLTGNDTGLPKPEERKITEKNEQHNEILETIDLSEFLNYPETQKDPKLDEKMFIEEHYLDEQKKEISNKEKVPDLDGESQNLESFDQLSDSEEPQERKIEWNWGDELKEEFGLGHLESEEAKFEMVNDENFEKEIEPESERESMRDLFAQLEKTLEHDKAFFDEDFHSEQRTVETEIPKYKSAFKDDEKVYLEFSGSPSKYEFIPAKTSEKDNRMAISLAEEPRDYFERSLSHDDEEGGIHARRKERRNGSSSKLFLLYFAVFAIVAVAVYLVIKNNSQPSESILRPVQQKNVSQAKIDSIKTAVENPSDSSELSLEESNDFPISATPPVPIKTSSSAKKLPNEINALTSKDMKPLPKQPDENRSSENKNSLYKTSKTDTRISNSIYYDGKNYNFQTSSWRNKITAEQEVQRLRSLGYKSYLLEAYLPQKGGTWYRVRIGPFNSEKEAQLFMRENNFK